MTTGTGNAEFVGLELSLPTLNVGAAMIDLHYLIIHGHVFQQLFFESQP